MIKQITVIAFFLFASIVGSAQISERPAYEAMLQGLLDHNVPELQVSQVIEMEGFIFLDSRSKEEYDVSHIPGAIWVGYDKFELDKVEDLDKDKVLIVYCSVGYRSEKVAKKIYDSGNKNVANLYGGIFQWIDEDGIVEDTNGPTLRVHAYDEAWGVWLQKGEKVY